MVCLKTIFNIKKHLIEKRKKEIYEIQLINSIDKYFKENNYYNDFENIEFKEIKFDEIFSEIDLNNLFLCLNNDEYLNKFYKVFHLLNFNTFKLPKKDLEKLFSNCFLDINYLYTYNIDFYYNCIRIDKNISFEKLININRFFQKYNILISYDFANSINSNEIIITFENCSISENFDNKNIDFDFSLLPNKFIRSY